MLVEGWKDCVGLKLQSQPLTTGSGSGAGETPCAATHAIFLGQAPGSCDKCGHSERHYTTLLSLHMHTHNTLRLKYTHTHTHTLHPSICCLLHVHIIILHQHECETHTLSKLTTFNFCSSRYERMSCLFTCKHGSTGGEVCWRLCISKRDRA